MISLKSNREGERQGPIPFRVPEMASPILDSEHLGRLKALIGEKPRPEVEFFLQETDSLLFWNQLFHWSLHLQRKGELHTSGALLNWIAEDTSLSVPASIRKRARTELAVLKGQGSFGRRAEFISFGFVDQVLNPSSLAGMLVGGAAYRVGRLLSLGKLVSFSSPAYWRTGWRAQALAGTGGFLLEVPAFTVSAKGVHQFFGGEENWSPGALLKEGAHGAILLGTLRLTGLGGRNVGRYWTPASEGLAKLGQRGIQQGAMFSGILGSRYLEALAGLNPLPQGDSIMGESLATLLQFNIAGAILHRGMGSEYRSWERSMDWRAGRLVLEGRPQDPFSPRTPLTLGPGLAFAMATSNPPGKLPRPKIVAPEPFGPQISLMSTIGESKADPALEAFREKFLPRFPTGKDREFSGLIVDTGHKTRLVDPEFKERLMEAYLETPNKGSREQYLTSLIIEQVFRYDAVNRADGTFEHALQQVLLLEGLGEANPARRNQILQDIFSAMEAGWSREKFISLSLRHGLGKNLKIPKKDTLSEEFRDRYQELATDAWKDYRVEDRELLFKYTYEFSKEAPEGIEDVFNLFGNARSSGVFPTELIDRVLDTARHHPQGLLVLHRMFNIFDAGTIPAKLAEIPVDVTSLDSVRLVSELAGQGLPKELIATKINGTRHTGYIEDIRLARKVASVMTEAKPWLEKGPKALEERRKKLETTILDYLKFIKKTPKNTIDAGRILFFLNITPTNLVSRLQKNLGRKFRMEFRPNEEFNKLLKENGYTDLEEINSIFVKSEGDKEINKIYHRGFPKLDISKEGKGKTFEEVTDRLMGTVHEGEHWRHSNKPQGMELPFKPLDFVDFNTHDRLVSEDMAYLEEWNWRVSNTDNDYGDYAKRLGLTVPHYLRSIGEEEYYSNGSAVRAVKY